MTLKVEVRSAPPVKQTPADARERERQQLANLALRDALAAQYPDGPPAYPRADRLGIDIEYQRGQGRSDAANVVGGVADQLERLRVYANDAQLVEIRYRESPAVDRVDRYSVTVSRVVAARRGGGLTTDAGTGAHGDRLKALSEQLVGEQGRIGTAGDDGQLANVDMQTWLQKMQQLLAMMSNLSKTDHDTAMAVIRNFKG